MWFDNVTKTHAIVQVQMARRMWMSPAGQPTQTATCLANVLKQLTIEHFFRSYIDL
jgi:hypothetical protein